MGGKGDVRSKEEKRLKTRERLVRRRGKRRKEREVERGMTREGEDDQNGRVREARSCTTEGEVESAVLGKE